ncbi:probable E3 ubiquitin-protein ligase makorin-1, partial [Anopheles moucheti]|uniref:probable E3 ubiquitin-protein ligase makorin-1 n=1 Tax=Anopheles moucheti TaxID=186751 RepID=UPI0022F11AD4
MENKNVPAAPSDTGATEKVETKHSQHGTCLFGSSSQSTVSDVIATQDGNAVGDVTPDSGETGEELLISEWSSMNGALRLVPIANESDQRVIETENHVNPEATQEELNDDEDDAVVDRSSVSSTSESSSIVTDEEMEQKLLPCKETDPNCPFAECDVHKEECDVCHKYCLVPGDTEDRRIHALECAKLQNTVLKCAAELELSRDKTCSVCMEVVMEKRPREQRFGILSGCKHVFCIKCIRSWRKSDNTKPVRRGCPVCRVESRFVCPSFVWVEDHKAKKMLI